MLPEGVKRLFRVRRDAGDQADVDVDDEIRFHLETRVDELMADGLGRDEAERRAAEEFGDVAAAKRALRRTSRRRERSTRRTEWLAELGRDVRFGWRKLAREPGFAAVAVLTLALGIGANTAIFSVVDAVLLRPLPYPDADRLVKIWETTPEGVTDNVVSSANYVDWREQATSFSVMGAHSWYSGMTLTGVEDPVRLRVTRITPSALAALGVQAEVGRTFTEADGDPGAPYVGLISHRLWAGRFGADPGVIGQTLTLDGIPVTVVGVMPASFGFPDPAVDVWAVLRFDAEDRANRRSHQWNVVARLADGVSMERAQAEMDAIADRIAVDHPEDMTGWGVNVVPLRRDLVGEARTLLLVLMGVVGVVLLLTCVNLANLLLARASAREREVAVRGALGAGRARVVRQLLVESLLIGVLGGGAALLVVSVGLDAMVALAPSDIPLLDGVRMDPVVAGFTLATTLLATLLFGLVPALRATAGAPAETLRGSRGAGVAHGRLRAGLLVAEVALAVVLVVGAGLLLRSMARLNAVDPGLDPDNVLVMLVDLPSARYGTTEEHLAFYRPLLDRVRGLPGVVSAAGTTEPPMLGYSMTFSYAIQGRPAGTPSGREDDERLMAVTPGYFETLGIPVVEGRALNAGDREGTTPVVVISEALARKQWPDGDAVGSRIQFREGQPWLEVVGVVGDARVNGLDRPAPPAIYMPFQQKLWDWMTWLALMVRTDGDPLALAPAVRDQVLAMDHTVLPEAPHTLAEVFAESNARRRFATTLLGVFAALALILGAVGVYGVLAYAVSRQTRELGVRIALGAPRSAVARRVVGRGLALAGAGVAIGILAALALSRFLESLVYGVGVRDPVTFIGIPVILLVVAAAAAYFPARRATRVDPMEALRAE